MSSLFYASRVAESQVMDEPGEVSAYDEAAAASHLDMLDTVCASQILAMSAEPGWWLDAGCGPGQIALKILRQKPCRIVGIDLAFNMLLRARERAAAGDSRHALYLVQADAARLPFKSGVFDLVYSNSLLHHAADPAALFCESARVMKSAGKFFLRDLIRPLRWRLNKHIEHFGRNYSGAMKRLFDASVRAAYTLPEVRQILRDTALCRSRVSREGGCYLVIRKL